MKKKEKIVIFILILITAILIVVNIIVKNRNSEENLGATSGNTDLVQISEDGTKTSISSEIAKKKQLDNLEVTDTKIVERNGLATMIANVTNNTGSEVKEFPVKIKLLNQKGEVIQEIGAYVGTIQQGETRQISASANIDISEINDFTISRK